MEKAKCSVVDITNKTLKTQCRRFFKERSSEIHGKKLEELSVQSKALEVVELEKTNNVWKRVPLDKCRFSSELGQILYLHHST